MCLIANCKVFFATTIIFYTFAQQSQVNKFMDKSKLNNILYMQDDLISMQELLLLQRLADKYPFCSLFWVLGAKVSAILDAFNQKEWLTKSVVYSSDREHLKQVFFCAKQTLQRKIEQQKASLYKQENKDILMEINSYREENLSENPTKEEIINRFLKIENPKISKQKDPENREQSIDNVIKNSVKEDISFATETMAKIYIKQGNKDKAIKIYQQLMVSNPQKSIYFANQIEKLKNS